MGPRWGMMKPNQVMLTDRHLPQLSLAGLTAAQWLPQELSSYCPLKYLTSSRDGLVI